MWLDGDVVMCGCPDCQAPLSVRLWLLRADCWRCGTSIELTEQQQAELRQLLERPPPPSPPASPPRRRPPRRPPRQALSPASEVAAPPLRPPTRRTSPFQPASRGFDAPPWLVSLLLHLALLVLLGLLTLGQDTDEFITISTAVHRYVAKGGELVVQDPDSQLAFDLPIDAGADLSDPRQRRRVLQADQDAQQIRLDPDAAGPHLPDLELVRNAVRSEDGLRAAFAARDPRVRVDIVRREGGTTLTEAAVSRGLSWLARHQQPRGNWSLHHFHRIPGCTCSHPGAIQSDAAGTSLALLPFLGAGQTHLVGVYRDTVSRGLRWMLDSQAEDGDLRADSTGNSGMYAHGQATIVLCEAFYMTGDEQLRVPAQKAIDFLVQAQHSDGGWRYQPGQTGDTSVLGWQLMALQSARAAQLTVPEETLELAGHYLDSASSHSGARYAYQPGRPADPVMTAEALLCREYLGWAHDTPGLRQGIRYLVTEHSPRSAPPNVYYWYYATQAVHHMGGDDWLLWNKEMREVLVDKQKPRGHEAGSWDPRDRHDRVGGRLYTTALATCTLEVYYRHLPLFRRIELE